MKMNIHHSQGQNARPPTIKILTNMKTIHYLLLSIILPVTCLVSATQAEPALSVQLLTTFDYPGATSTTPLGINELGDVAGYFVDASGATRGFVRFRNGRFSAPIVEPNDGTSTQGQGINTSRVTCGFYLNPADGLHHGYFRTGNTFTEFNVTGATETLVFGSLTDAGDFVGSFSDVPFGALQGYINVGGTTTVVNVPGASGTEPLGLNSAHESVGLYFDPSGLHGFFRDAAGVLTYPWDIPGATFTELVDLNDSGRIVGAYGDSAGLTHGVLMTSTGTFIPFDYPGQTVTALTAINNAGLICGLYIDSAGASHGFTARSR